MVAGEGIREEAIVDGGHGEAVTLAHLDPRPERLEETDEVIQQPLLGVRPKGHRGIVEQRHAFDEDEAPEAPGVVERQPDDLFRLGQIKQRACILRNTASA